HAAFVRSRATLVFRQRPESDTELDVADGFGLAGVFWNILAQHSGVILNHFRAIADGDLEVHLLAVAVHVQRGRITYRSIRDASHQVAAILDGLAVDADDDVFFLQSSRGGGSALDH